MALDQNEIQELLELFPNSRDAIERFSNSTAANEALDKLDKKISQLKEKLAGLKVNKAKEREEFNEKVNNLFKYGIFTNSFSTSYSQIDIFLAENSLNQLNTDDLIDNQDKLFSDYQETKDVLLNAWLENYNDREIKALESSILDLQTLIAQLTA